MSSASKEELDGLLRFKHATGNTVLSMALSWAVPHDALLSMFSNIIRKGIDLEQILAITNNEDYYALHWAAQKCSLDGLKLVIKHSPSSALTAKIQDGRTPLVLARDNKLPDNVEYLEEVSTVI